MLNIFASLKMLFLPFEYAIIFRRRRLSLLNLLFDVPIEGYSPLLDKFGSHFTSDLGYKAKSRNNQIFVSGSYMIVQVLC